MSGAGLPLRCRRPLLRGLLILAMVVAAFASSEPARAGRPCDPQPPSALGVERAMTLAARTAAALEASGARVVVLARVGQDLSAHRLRYSHLGFAYKDSDRPGAAWRVVHKLNHCSRATASLYRQGLGEFFLDDLHEYEAGFAVPAARVQRELVAVLRDNRRLSRLHVEPYSMVAYPWALRYQQSNQWAIETLAMTLEPAVTSRERAQAWLKLHAYEPTTLRLSAVTRIGARMTAANVAFDDHPSGRRLRDRIDTVTVDSVFQWLERSGLGGRVVTVR